MYISVGTVHKRSFGADLASDSQEKAKRAAWEKLVHDKVSPQDAQKRYVTLVDSLKKKHGFTG